MRSTAFHKAVSSKEERRSRNVPDRQTYLRKPPLQRSHTDKSLASSCSKMVEACWPKRAKITWRRLVGFLICSITVESAIGAGAERRKDDTPHPVLLRKIEAALVSAAQQAFICGTAGVDRPHSVKNVLRR